MSVLGEGARGPCDGSWGALGGVANQLACLSGAEGAFLAPPGAQVCAWLSGPAVSVGTGLDYWRGCMGCLGEAVLVVVPGAVGS